MRDQQLFSDPAWPALFNDQNDQSLPTMAGAGANDTHHLSMLDEFHFPDMSFEDAENMFLPSSSLSSSGVVTAHSDRPDDVRSDFSSEWTPTSSSRGSPSPSPSSPWEDRMPVVDNTKFPTTSKNVSPCHVASTSTMAPVVDLPKNAKPLPPPPPHPSMTQIKKVSAPKGPKQTSTGKNLVTRVSSGSLASSGSPDFDTSNHGSQPFLQGLPNQGYISPTESSIRRTVANPLGLVPLAPLVPMSGPATMALARSNVLTTSSGRKNQLKAPPASSLTSGVAAENMDRKRKHSLTKSSSNLTLTSNVDEFDQVLTEEEMEVRRERNRVHAKKSRQRKKCLTTELKLSLDILREENEKIRQFIYSRIGEEQTEEILSKRRLESHRNFISSLKSDKNRVVDSKTATYLRGLRRNVLNLNKKSSPKKAPSS
mmetsp:Transcript_58987/g.144313  ORF Transcript_58987/g.144313 Transcript_58987/m.144313 type:complete len:426 (+) Transcript_58987:212-1489(+)